MNTAFAPNTLRTIDAAASSVAFRVRHFGFSTVEGRFREVEGSFGAGGIVGSVEVASIDSGNEVRDGRLVGPEFFDAARFPVIGFRAAGPVRPAVTGWLTIRDVTRPVAFDVRVEGSVLQATARISRRAFGLDWAGLREAGRLVVSDRVDLLLDLRLREMTP